MDPGINQEVVERFSRQLLLPGWSLDAQTRLSKLKVGYSGSLIQGPLYLSAVGVGYIYLLSSMLNDAFCHQSVLGLSPQVGLGELDSNSFLDYLISPVLEPGEQTESPTYDARVTIGLARDGKSLALRASDKLIGAVQIFDHSTGIKPSAEQLVYCSVLLLLDFEVFGGKYWKISLEPE